MVLGENDGGKKRLACNFSCGFAYSGIFFLVFCFTALTALLVAWTTGYRYDLIYECELQGLPYTKQGKDPCALDSAEKERILDFRYRFEFTSIKRHCA